MITPRGTPVSSKVLVDKYNLGISTATARNEMVALTEQGYLRQPHTSAGREPTEEGYRYFVQRIVGENELPLAEVVSYQPRLNALTMSTRSSKWEPASACR